MRTEQRRVAFLSKNPPYFVDKVRFELMSKMLLREMLVKILLQHAMNF